MQAMGGGHGGRWDYGDNDKGKGKDKGKYDDNYETMKKDIEKLERWMGYMDDRTKKLRAENEELKSRLECAESELQWRPRFGVHSR